MSDEWHAGGLCFWRWNHNDTTGRSHDKRLSLDEGPRVEVIEPVRPGEDIAMIVLRIILIKSCLSK